METAIEMAWHAFTTHYLPLVETDVNIDDDTTSRTKSTKRSFALTRLSFATRAHGTKFK